jgi:hypothetical protein
MKILNLSFMDAAGAGYALSHALNKLPYIQSINLRSSNNYIDYPSIAEMRYYRETECRKIVEAADVIIFHTAVLPFLTGLKIDKEKLAFQKKLLYFHGSDARNYGAQIIAQADEMFGKDGYRILVSTPDLLRLIPRATWMPVARGFKDLHAKFALCNQDERALKSFGGAQEKLVFAHAPTSQERKGSELFFKIITELIEHYKNAEFLPIQNMSWDAALRSIAHADIFYDQHVLGAYGLAAVEASIFNEAIFVRLDPDVIEVMEKESGLKNPFIQWANEEELRERSITLCEKPSLIGKFGERAHAYCLKMHDEMPVVSRLVKVIEAM